MIATKTMLPVYEPPAPGFFGKRALVLPCNMPLEHLRDVESHMAAYGYQVCSLRSGAPRGNGA